MMVKDIMKIFMDAYIEDHSSVGGWFKCETTKTAFNAFQLKEQKAVLEHFSRLTSMLKSNILECKHPSIKSSYHGYEECNICGCHRRLEESDKVPYGKTWGEWTT